MIPPALIAFGLNTIILVILGTTSYFFTDTLKSLLVKSIATGCLTTIIWAYAIYPEKNNGLLPWRVLLQRNMITFAILFIMLLISLGVALSGKMIQQKNIPNPLFLCEQKTSAVTAEVFYFLN